MRIRNTDVMTPDPQHEMKRSARKPGEMEQFQWQDSTST
jgi:hypothetical protein